MAHRLETPWTFYYQERSPKGNGTQYASSIRKIGRFSTCEEFWGFYSHILRPEDISRDIALQMFRNDTRAMWEDEANSSGGSFRINTPRGSISLLWEKLILNMIGEQLPGDVTGAVASNRGRGNLLTIWHATARDEAVRNEIALGLARVLDLPHRSKIDYCQFTDVMGGRAAGQFLHFAIENEGGEVRVIPRQR